MKKILLLLSISLVILLSSCEYLTFEYSYKNTSTNKTTKISTTSINKTTTSKKDSSTSKDTTSKITKEITTKTSGKTTTTKIENEYKELFKDSYYKDGFRVYYPDEGNPKTYSNKLVTVNTTSTPTWELAQWSSKYDIMNAKRSSGFGEYSFINSETTPASKKVIINSTTGTLRIVLNAESEYSEDRKSGEGWPSLLFQQNFDSNLINISSMEEINMIIDFKINSCENKTISKYNESLHCAQFVWYITLQNRNQSSKDYGKYVWFGLNLFDSRYAGTVTTEFASQDGGKENNTGCFIYQPSSKAFMESGKMTTVGVNTSISFNIMDIVKDVYDLAIERGYLGSTKYEELYIGSTNFGFEVPGTFNIDATISKIQIEYK